MIGLFIQNGSSIYQPVVVGEVQWETERKGQPGKLTFSVFNDGVINFQEGNAVVFQVDDIKLFYGFIFKKEREKDRIIKVTAYDQLRYLKNKNTYKYANKTVGELIRMIAADFNLQTGLLEDTGYKIPSRIEDNKSLMEIIQNALDITLQNTKQLYVLYDDFGKLTLRNIESMKLNLLIDEETAENFQYSSSIDGETYNKIKLSYENKESGKRDIYITQDSRNINQWGVLQYYESVDDSANVKAKADALLKLYNNKKRSLTISNAFGDVSVRAGSSIPVHLVLGDVAVQNYMVVEKVTHTFDMDTHMMDLTLKGGAFNA